MYQLRPNDHYGTNHASAYVDMKAFVQRFLVYALILMAARIPVCADWLYDGYPIYNQGIAIGKGGPTEMVAQPFSLTMPAWIDQFGVAIASGPDPNHVGFRVMLAEDPRDLGKTTLASWQVFPIYGPTLMFAYWSVKPMLLEAGRTYYVVLTPGDSEFMGAVAYATRGNIALSTNDNGVNWFEVAHLGVRVGGTPVPEPSGMAVLGVGCWVLGRRSRKGRRT